MTHPLGTADARTCAGCDIDVVTDHYVKAAGMHTDKAKGGKH